MRCYNNDCGHYRDWGSKHRPYSPGLYRPERCDHGCRHDDFPYNRSREYPINRRRDEYPRNQYIFYGFPR